MIVITVISSIRVNPESARDGERLSGNECARRRPRVIGAGRCSQSPGGSNGLIRLRQGIPPRSSFDSDLVNTVKVQGQPQPFVQ